MKNKKNLIWACVALHIDQIMDIYSHADCLRDPQLLFETLIIECTQTFVFHNKLHIVPNDIIQWINIRRLMTTTGRVAVQNFWKVH